MGFFSKRSKTTEPKQENTAVGEDQIPYREAWNARKTGVDPELLFLLAGRNGLPMKDRFMDGVFDDTFMGILPRTGCEHVCNGLLALSASRGNSDAQFDLAFNYEHGIGVEKDIKTAISWYNKAAAGGNFNALYCLGCIYATEGSVVDYYKAYTLFSRASTEGVSRAGYILYVMCMKGMGMDEPNNYIAAKCLKQAAEEKDPLSLYVMGQLALYGSEYVERGGEKAWKYFEESAALGCVPAMTALGIMLCFGLGGRNPDRDLAYEVVCAASANGDTVAANALGLMHLYSMTSSCFPANAGEFFRIAAGDGNGPAMNNLAVLRHVNGIGDGPDASDIFKQAAAAGSVHAKQNSSALEAGKPMACELRCGRMTLSLTMDEKHAEMIRSVI